jgi:transcriptional regulator with XRE-family HTH domain
MDVKELNLILEKIVNRLKEIRLSKNYKQEYLAAKIGCSQNSYSKIESRRTELTVRNLYQISRVLGIEVTDVLKNL